MFAYSAHEKLVAPARSSASLWYVFGGLCLFVFGTIALEFGLMTILQSQGLDALARERAYGRTEAGVLFALFAFLMPAMVLWVVLRLIHERGLRSLVGPSQETLRDFFRVMIAGFLLVGMFLILPVAQDMRPISHLSFAVWLRWLPLALLAVFIQVTCEELIFRGYLQSQLAARFSAPVIWILVPSLLFGALHYAPNIYGDNALLVALWAFLFGIFAADLTARAGNLGPAVALHFVNNVFGILIVGLQGQLDGLALMVTPFGPSETELLRVAIWIELPALCCMWLAARIAIRR